MPLRMRTLEFRTWQQNLSDIDEIAVHQDESYFSAKILDLAGRRVGDALRGGVHKVPVLCYAASLRIIAGSCSLLYPPKYSVPSSLRQSHTGVPN